jgi:hypothetical protein
LRTKVASLLLSKTTIQQLVSPRRSLKHRRKVIAKANKYCLTAEVAIVEAALVEVVRWNCLMKRLTAMSSLSKDLSERVY